MVDQTSIETDLLVVGAGHLGSRVIALWRARFPATEIVAETASVTRHPSLSKMSAAARLRSDGDLQPRPNVLVALPPSAVDDYPREIARAARLWNKVGRLVMISSTAVYDEKDGGTCQEASVVASNARARRLLNAEETVLTEGGIVIRMAGLYDQIRGPHIVYLKKRESQRRPDGLINLIHYDDAAELCFAALTRGEPRAVFLGCDAEPIERQDLVNATVASGLYGDAEELRPCVFTGTAGPVGCRCDNSQTRATLDWRPRHQSFAQWLELEPSRDECQR